MSAAADTVLAAIARVTGLEQADISRGACLDFDLCCDTLDVVEIVMQVEQDLGVAIDEHFLPQTVEALIKRAERAGAQGRAGERLMPGFYPPEPDDEAPIRWWEVLIGSVLVALSAFALIWGFAILDAVLTGPPA